VDGARSGIILVRGVPGWLLSSTHLKGAPSMDKNITDLSTVATVGLDLAKHVFQVHAVDVEGRRVATRALRRKDVLAFFERLPCCLVGMEACGSAPSLGAPVDEAWP
jgi:transposase